MSDTRTETKIIRDFVERYFERFKDLPKNQLVDFLDENISATFRQIMNFETIKLHDFNHLQRINNLKWTDSFTDNSYEVLSILVSVLEFNSSNCCYELKFSDFVEELNDKFGDCRVTLTVSDVINLISGARHDDYDDFTFGETIDLLYSSLSSLSPLENQ